MLACDVPVRFSKARGIACRFDFLLTERLDEQGYGLMSLRDLLNHFSILTEGPFRLGPGGQPLQLPILRLYPRGTWQLIGYHCPACGAMTWGRPGLNLGCNDCNRPMVASG